VTITVVALLLAFPTIGIFSAPGPSGTSTEWSVGSGLTTMSALQQVSAQAYWSTYCPPAKGACMIPVGVAYVPSAERVLLTELNDTSIGGGMNAFLEFDPGTLLSTAPTPLNCTPGIPFYPGVGIEVLVPCWNATLNLLAVDIQTAQVTSSAVVPVLNGYASSMTYAPASGLVYWAANSNDIVVINQTNDRVVATVALQQAAFEPGLFGGAYNLVWDSASDSLVMPSAASGLILVDPGSWIVKQTLSLPAPALALADDPATNQLLVSTANGTARTSSVLVFNASTYTLEATLSIPNCVDNACALPNEVNQILMDPAYGDAYFVSTDAFFALNLTTLTILSALEDYGDGPQLSSVFVPGFERVFGTYESIFIGPGFLVTIDHGSVPVLSQILWLPTSVAEILLAGAVGTVLAFRRPGGKPFDERELVASVFRSRDGERYAQDGEDFDLPPR